jgi:hypothetical protein
LPKCTTAIAFAPGMVGNPDLTDSITRRFRYMKSGLSLTAGKIFVMKYYLFSMLFIISILQSPFSRAETRVVIGEFFTNTS